MILDLAPDWKMEVDRGPDWVFIRLHGKEPFDTDGIELSNRLARVLEQEFSHRLVLELDDIRVMNSHFVAELVTLHKQLHDRGGLLRISGLSDENYSVLCASKLGDRFPQYHTREDAVMGYRPAKPR